MTIIDIACLITAFAQIITAVTPFIKKTRHRR